MKCIIGNYFIVKKQIKKIIRDMVFFKINDGGNKKMWRKRRKPAVSKSQRGIN